MNGPLGRRCVWDLSSGGTGAASRLPVQKQESHGSE